MSVKGFRDGLIHYLPAWLSPRPGKINGYAFVWCMIAPLDALIEVTLQGVRAKFPQLADPSALPLIGRSRGIPQGIGEPNSVYATRLLTWLDDWTRSGSEAIGLRMLQSYLGNHPTVRFITRAGRYTSIAPDGTVTATSAAWDWDSASSPSRADRWADMWIVVYPTQWAVAGTVGATQDLIFDGDAVGHAVSGAQAGDILSIVRDWVGAHIRVEAIVWSYDSSLFDPSSPSAPGNPDGTWGDWARTVGGAMVPARNPNCRYWIPESA